jgi:predicted Zn-dependent protease
MSYLGDKYRHKAEGELQAAVKLDPANAKIRMMLVDFFVDMSLSKRAIGELNRFLEISPGNKDAISALNRLQTEPN